MKTIYLTRGMVALVDDRDYDFLSMWKWHAFLADGRWYAKRNVGRKAILMHRVILPEAGIVDHEDGCGLNNQRYNLRPASVSQNCCNRGRQSNNQSGFKGVSPCATTGLWRAVISFGKKRFDLGRFRNPERAARAYDDQARILHGSFAHLNFP